MLDAYVRYFVCGFQLNVLVSALHKKEVSVITGYQVLHLVVVVNEESLVL